LHAIAAYHAQLAPLALAERRVTARPWTTSSTSPGSQAARS